MKLTGRRCQCGDCGEYFNSVAAFDRHRVGVGRARKCMPPASLGMVKNRVGYWITAPYAAAARREAGEG